MSPPAGVLPPFSLQENTLTDNPLLSPPVAYGNPATHLQTWTDKHRECCQWQVEMKASGGR